MLALAAPRNSLAHATIPNDAETTPAGDKSRGRCEWDAAKIGALASRCLRGLSRQLSDRIRDVAGIGLTGQQHGVVLVDPALIPVTPFINWQDRRAEEVDPRTDTTYLHQARSLLGQDARGRTGCTLAPGFMGLTLYWMKSVNAMPTGAMACFIMDYVGATLTGTPPVTDATCAGSSGLLDARTRQWDRGLIEALGLSALRFPEIREAAQSFGRLTARAAEATGLRAGLPVCVPAGDNQASFFGSVAHPDETILVNVGTGGQVAAHTERFVVVPALETRPFPGAGYLLVNGGLCGGRTYALLERFFRQVGESLFGLETDQPLYEAMNRLASHVPRGADGLRWEPLFTGTRENPTLRGEWSGASPENLTPPHMVRALLEGMARVFRGGYDLIRSAISASPRCPVGAGNGVRENPVLAGIVTEEFGLPLSIPAPARRPPSAPPSSRPWGWTSSPTSPPRAD